VHGQLRQPLGHDIEQKPQLTNVGTGREKKDSRPKMLGSMRRPADQYADDRSETGGPER